MKDALKGMHERFQDLIAWQKSMEMVVQVYKLSKSFPSDERFGLTSQSRRSAVSVPCNIAEGFGRRTKADYMHFLDVAAGSANELMTQLLIVKRLGMSSGSDLDLAMALTEESQRLVRGTMIAIEKSCKPRRDSIPST